MTKVLVVANRKGGTAKTTTVVNLAYALSEKGAKVLVIDLDNQGHIELGFTAQPDLLSALSQPAWMSEFEEFKGVLAYSDRIHLALAHTDSAFDESAYTLDRFSQLFDNAGDAGHYDIILVDTPPTLGPRLLSALAGAHRIVIPAEPTPLASDGVNKLLNACMKAIRNKHFRASGIDILPVMVDGKLRIHRQTLGLWQEKFGAGRILPAIRRNVKLAEAFAVHQPVSEYAPLSAGAKDYRSLCDSLFS
ncbi:ParA family protein [Alteromonas sp. 1_MG-2023]|uniref:ParA family protein n=1 Tax=Alteromonas sp. 1_MG-2023 TaxID=3062669 RepID=UPI0026E12E6C|nr:ParA family protein [Alteromonas sp. 1_MG-2023]MDO6474779.1 ParA family protein [Alteromonas sp. 1_MG-2023]